MPKKNIKTKVTDKIIQKAIELAIYGLSYSETDKVLALDDGTLEKYAKCSPDFKRTIENAELLATIEVERSLLKRANGYETTEEHKIYVPNKTVIEGEEPVMVLKEIKYVKKMFPPDGSACLIWLYNRRSKRWSKNPDSSSNVSIEDFLREKDQTAKQARENM